MLTSICNMRVTRPFRAPGEWDLWPIVGRIGRRLLRSSATSAADSTYLLSLTRNSEGFIGCFPTNGCKKMFYSTLALKKDLSGQYLALEVSIKISVQNMEQLGRVKPGIPEHSSGNNPGRWFGSPIRVSVDVVIEYVLYLCEYMNY